MWKLSAAPGKNSGGFAAVLRPDRKVNTFFVGEARTIVKMSWHNLGMQRPLSRSSSSKDDSLFFTG